MSSFNAFDDTPIPVEPCKCGYQWRADALPEEICHHAAGGGEYIVICPRCKADGELKATPKWAVEAWNAKRFEHASRDPEAAKLEMLLEALKAIREYIPESCTTWSEDEIAGICDAALGAANTPEQQGDGG